MGCAHRGAIPMPRGGRVEAGCLLRLYRSVTLPGPGPPCAVGHSAPGSPLPSPSDLPLLGQRGGARGTVGPSSGWPLLALTNSPSALATLRRLLLLLLLSAPPPLLRARRNAALPSGSTGYNRLAGAEVSHWEMIVL